MAKLYITFLLFFFVVSFSHARDLIDRSENEVSVAHLTAGTVEDHSNSKAAIFLPSQKLFEYETPKSIAEPDQVRTEFNPSEISAADTKETGSDPLVVITFRPINRQFGRRSVPLMFRRGGRGCHHRHNFKPWRLINRAGERPYGNDMIVSDERSSPNSDGNWGSGSYREIAIPSKLSELRHVEPWGSYRSDSKEDRKHLHHHHFHHHHRQEEEEEEHEHEDKDKEKNGFLRNFRKFLNQFEF